MSYSVSPHWATVHPLHGVVVYQVGAGPPPPSGSILGSGPESPLLFNLWSKRTAEGSIRSSDAYLIKRALKVPS